jgi:hypothetical protein
MVLPENTGCCYEVECLYRAIGVHNRSIHEEAAGQPWNSLITPDPAGSLVTGSRRWRLGGTFSQ